VNLRRTELEARQLPDRPCSNNTARHRSTDQPGRLSAAAPVKLRRRHCEPPRPRPAARRGGCAVCRAGWPACGGAYQSLCWAAMGSPGHSCISRRLSWAVFRCGGSAGKCLEHIGGHLHGEPGGAPVDAVADIAADRPNPPRDPGLAHPVRCGACNGRNYVQNGHGSCRCALRADRYTLGGSLLRPRTVWPRPGASVYRHPVRVAGRVAEITCRPPRR
jgi:hypothetical protein